MNTILKGITLSLLITFPALLPAQSAHRFLRKGDSEYKEQEFQDAEENYRKALIKKNSAQGAYNLGNSIYSQDRYEEAAKQYEEALVSSSNNQLKALTYHNLGNTYFQQGDYEKSIDAYKNALRLNPQDMETKYNLALAQNRFQAQQPPPQDQNQQQDQQSQQQDDKNQPNDQNQQPQNQPQPNEQNSNQENQPQREQTDAKDLTKEEARQLLEIMEEEERKVQEKIRKAHSKPPKSGKDW